MPFSNTDLLEANRQAKEKSKRDILIRFYAVAGLLGLFTLIFSPERWDSIYPELVYIITILTFSFTLPLKFSFLIDIAVVLNGCVMVPYINYKGEDIFFILVGWTILIPSIVLFLTQNPRAFLFMMVIYAALPLLFIEIIKSKIDTLKTPDGLKTFISGLMIITICTCSLLMHFYNKIKASEKLAWEAQQQSEKARNALQQFILSFSHELRNPLNILRGNISLALEEPDLSQQLIGYLETTNSCTEVLLQLINNILDTGKLQQGNLMIASSASNIRSMVNSVWQVYRTTIQNKNLNGVVKIDKAVPPNLRLDSIRITQVMMNLISNAIKFTKRGKVELRLDWVPEKQVIDDNCFKQNFFDVVDQLENSIPLEGEIKVDNLDILTGNQSFMSQFYTYNLNDKLIPLNVIEKSSNTEQQGVLKITVLDQGVGMSQQTLSKIFQRFSQGSEEETSRNMGTGLGLYITKEIINLSGGQIRVFSEKGRGSAFVAAIPTHYTPDFDHQQLNEQMLQKVKQKKLRCVIADDSVFNNQLVQHFISKVNGQVDKVFFDGASAFNYFNSLDFNKKGQMPNVLITDIDMPGMNGIKLCQQLRQLEDKNQVLNKCQIIIITGNDAESDQLRVLKDEVKVTDIMRKPISIDRLILNLSKNPSIRF